MGVLIGGGSGFIGSRLTKTLIKHGYDVTIVSRMPGPKRLTWHELESNGLPKNTKVVINLAGQNVLEPSRRWTPGFKQNVWNSRINSSAAMVRAILTATVKPEIFVNVSGISHYRPDQNCVYTESSPVSDYDFMSKLCIEWEKSATLPTDASTRTVKIRSGVVLGREGGMIQSLMLPFWLGLGGRMGDGKQHLPWIHIIDLCELIRFCIETKSIDKAILNGVAPDIITNEQFTKTFASALRRPAIFPLPEQIIQLIFGDERAVMLLKGPKIQPEEVLKAGFAYRYPKILEACQEVVKKV